MNDRQTISEGARRSHASLNAARAHRPRGAMSPSRPVALADVGALFLVLVLFWQAANLVAALPNDLFDFRIFRDAGGAVLHGQSPWSVQGFLYPPFGALLFAPLAAVPFWAGAVPFTLLAAAVLVAALYVLDIRDWRCYAAMLASYPAAISVSTGTLSGLMLLLVAVSWRYRDRRWLPGLAVGSALALKLFLWPLVIWLIVTRRTWQAMAAVSCGVIMTMSGWAIIGMGQLQSYRGATETADALARVSYSPYAFLNAAGFSAPWARLAVAVVGAAILAACLRARGDDVRAFNLAVAAALVMSPVLWIHYFVLLYVPIALTRPRLSGLWFLPATFFLVGLKAHADGSVSRISVNLAVAALAFVVADRALTKTRWATPQTLSPTEPLTRP